MWKDYLPAMPWLFTGAALTYAVYVTFHFTRRKDGKTQVNYKIDKNNSKVVHTVDIEDIGTKAVYCRCWRSSKFPFCDGSHSAHNELTGDNVGPLIVKKKEA